MSDMRERIEALSPRQREVLFYVAQHFSSKEIGRELGVSAATVDSHIAAALQRLQLNTRRDAAMLVIELGYPLVPDVAQGKEPSTSGHHGDDQRSNPRPLRQPKGISTSHGSTGGDGEPPIRGPTRGDGDEPPLPPAKSGMGPVIVRYLLDAIYIILFFAVMSAVAFGAHWIVIRCQALQIDPIVLLILRGVSYMLVALDAIGVVAATGLLTYRFIRAIVTADD